MYTYMLMEEAIDTATMYITGMDLDMNITNEGLTRLARVLQFGDSMLPIGAFSFSCGLESAVQNGVVKDIDTLKSFVITSLSQAASCDAVGVAHAYRAVAEGNYDDLLMIDREIINRKLNEEIRLMTLRMGKKLAEMALHVLDDSVIKWWLGEITKGAVAGTLPVTQALVMQAQKVSLEETIVMHQYGVAMTILSAAQRLMRITHFDSQRILFDVNNEIANHCNFALTTRLCDMAAYTPQIDILAALHVNAHVRLFMN